MLVRQSSTMKSAWQEDEEPVAVVVAVCAMMAAGARKATRVTKDFILAVVLGD